MLGGNRPRTCRAEQVHTSKSVYKLFAFQPGFRCHHDQQVAHSIYHAMALEHHPGTRMETISPAPMYLGGMITAIAWRNARFSTELTDGANHVLRASMRPSVIAASISHRTSHSYRGTQQKTA